MKRILTIATVFIALSGCASVSGLREKSPEFSFTSKKSPQQVGQCVAYGWGNFFGINVNQGDSPNGGYYVSMPDIYAGNHGVMDAYPSQNGSHIDVRYRFSSIVGHGRFTDVVKRCI